MLTVRAFISSTWIDLREEREAVERILQRLRQTRFVGMEVFRKPGRRQPDDVVGGARSLRYLHRHPRASLWVGPHRAEYLAGSANGALPCLIYRQRRLPDRRSAGQERGCAPASRLGVGSSRAARRVGDSARRSTLPRRLPPTCTTFCSTGISSKGLTPSAPRTPNASRMS